jgi:hypothetical protein
MSEFNRRNPANLHSFLPHALGNPSDKQRKQTTLEFGWFSGSLTQAYKLKPLISKMQNGFGYWM